MQSLQNSIKNLKEIREKFLKQHPNDEFVFNYFEQVYAIVSSYISIVKINDNYDLKVSNNLNREEQYNVYEFKELFDNILNMIKPQKYKSSCFNVDDKLKQMEQQRRSETTEQREQQRKSETTKSQPQPTNTKQFSYQSEINKLQKQIEQLQSQIKLYTEKLNEKRDNLDELKTVYYSKINECTAFNDVYPQFEELYDTLTQFVQISINKNKNGFDLLIESEKLTDEQHAQIKNFKLLFKFIKLIAESD